MTYSAQWFCKKRKVRWHPAIEKDSCFLSHSRGCWSEQNHRYSCPDPVLFCGNGRSICDWGDLLPSLIKGQIHPTSWFLQASHLQCVTSMLLAWTISSWDQSMDQMGTSKISLTCNSVHHSMWDHTAMLTAKQPGNTLQKRKACWDVRGCG